MVASKTFLAASALLAATASAHFTIDYPTSRGFKDDTATEFCGGFPNVGPRQPFSLTNGPIWVNSAHAKGDLFAMVSAVANPANPPDFNPMPVTKWISVPEGESCWNIDLSSMNMGLKNGSEVTIQVVYEGGDGSLMQCTDLVLMDNYSAPADRTCTKDAAVAYSATYVPGPISLSAALGPEDSPGGAYTARSSTAASGAAPTGAAASGAASGAAPASGAGSSGAASPTASAPAATSPASSALRIAGAGGLSVVAGVFAFALL